MSRVSLIEQYNNKDVITQIYDVKEKLESSIDDVDQAVSAANSATTAANAAATAANNAVSATNQLASRTAILEGYVGSPSDTASASGSVYARIAENASDIAENAGDIDDLGDAVSANASDIADIKPVIQGLPTTYQQKSQKDAINGYPGLSSAGKIATSQIDTGVALNQVLVAGAQLNVGEVLYVGTGGIIRSRIVGEGVEYVGNYASLAALQAYPEPRNGDFGTVYGSVSDDGMYMYDGSQWNFVMLFDATAYELVSNKVTGISSASTNDGYPSAKAVYDFCVANDVAGVDVTQVTSSNKVTVTVAVSNSAGTTIATDSVDIPTTSAVTASSNVPITSGGVKTAIDTVNGNITTAVSAKQNTLTSTTVTLAVANWSSNTQTVTGISNVTATNIVWVSPAAASLDEYGACGIRVTAQGSGSLTFHTNGTTPENALTVVVVGA